jgi:hypothetical protein
MKLSQVIKYVVIWQLAIILITLLSATSLPLRSDYLGGGLRAYQKNPLLYSRLNFDGVHYLSIAANGYGYAQQAFFPLYPKLISIISKTFIGADLGSVLISLACFTVGLYYFSKLIRMDLSENATKWTIISLLIFPVSFYFSAAYTEGLFFLLCILSFYNARKSRWLLASIFGFLASYTRVVGVMLFPALIIEWLIQYRQHVFKNILSISWLLIIPAGLFIYMFYLQQTTGDALAFAHVQKLFGQGRSDEIVLIYQVIWRYLKMIFTVDRTNPLYITIWLEFITGISFLAISLVSLFKSRPSYAIFSFLSYLLPTLSGVFTSVPRYVLICFPAFMLIGQYLSKSSFRHKLVYVTLSIIAAMLFTALFVRGYWVS